MNTHRNIEQGKYIVIEGLDGTGKGEQTKILAAKLGEYSIKTILVAEPGETPAGEVIRNIVKNADYDLDGQANTLLFTANRRDIWVKHIQPALKNGTWVIGDRNWYSTAAYQLYGQQIPISLEVLQQLTYDFVDKKYAHPDLSLILTLPEEIREQRLNNRGSVQEAPDAFETQNRNFQSRVENGYKEVARFTKSPIIDASGTRDQAHSIIWSYVEKLINK